MTDNVLESEGYKKAKAQAERMKVQTEEKLNTINQEGLTMTGDLQTVAGLSLSAEVAGFYQSHASVGSENIAQGALPLLKVVDPKSSLPDGIKPQYGQFYYAPTQEQIETAEVSIMYVSRGFYAKAFNKDDKKPKFNQIVAGMFLENMQPFVMYVTGLKLQNLWDFGKEISPFTKAKQNGVPMYAFKVNLSTDTVKTENGTNYVVKFDLVRNESKQIQLITDMGLITVLNSGVESMKQTIESVIAQKEVNKDTGELLKSEDAELSTSEVGEAIVGEEEPMPEPSPEDLSKSGEESKKVADDIPF